MTPVETSEERRKRLNEEKPYWTTDKSWLPAPEIEPDEPEDEERQL